MMAKREKVTVSLYDRELIIIEEIKKQLSDNSLLVAATTSEVVRIALYHLSKISNSALENALNNVPDRRMGRPKTKNKPNLFPSQ